MEVVIVVLIWIHSGNFIVFYMLISPSYIFFYKVLGQVFCLFLLSCLFITQL